MLAQLLSTITLIVLIGLHGANAQNFPPLDVAAAGSTRAAVEIGISPIRLCQLSTTTQLLGYNGLGVPIYKNQCVGICLSTITAPRECRPTEASIIVYTQPTPTLPCSQTVRVTQVVACNCLPRRCKVNRNGVDIYYNHGATVLDACERRCTCSYGNLINCCRQRKEFRLGLTTTERERYINAVKIASTTAPYKATYDALIQKHATLFSGSGIHSSSMFLPWHREYIWDLEELLRKIDCRVTVPYWRWSLEAANPFASTIWANSPSGFGGNGSPSGSCIATGPFAPPWQTSQSPPQCLRRAWFLSATFATEADITTTLDVTCPLATQFHCMRTGIESYHNYVHSAIGGQMTSIHSSNDPIFFMHHTYIDRIWARWQAKSAAHVTAYSGSTATVLPGSTYTVNDWLDLNKQQGNPNNRVCYIDPPSSWWVDTVLASTARAVTTDSLGALATPEVLPNIPPFYGPCTTPARLQYLPRVPLGPFPREWLALMRMTTEQLAAEQAFHDQRNNPTIYNLLDLDRARQTPGVTSSFGFYLYDEDYKCIEAQGRAAYVADGGVEPPYSE